ncbi:MAG: sigma-70 family RNA polymerase sigma factor, partial [Bacilli bacterium]|nr:sigma-70 family RNA polymerase sigma factor [Bacilli bacterium]
NWNWERLLNEHVRKVVSILQNLIEFNLEIIIEEYSGYVFKIVDNIVGATLNYQDKEEIMADTFYLLWQNQAKIDTNLKAYLGAIARNCAYSKLRQSNVCYEVQEEIIGYQEQLDEIITIKEKLQRLSDEERMLFHKYYVLGLKVKEIAKELGKSASNIKIKLYRLRKRLKEDFNE